MTRRGAARVAAVAVLALLAAGCSGGGHGAGQVSPAARASAEAAAGAGGGAGTAAGPRVTITPGNGAGRRSVRRHHRHSGSRHAVARDRAHLRRHGVRQPEQGRHGLAQQLGTRRLAVLHGHGHRVRGGAHRHPTSTFRTLTPRQTFRTEIFEGYHQTYGVGMPIILTFSQPITNKAAVERSLQLTTSTPVVGAWYWDGNQTLRLPAAGLLADGTTVSFTGHLNGVQGAPGVYGAHTLTQTFDIGASLIAIGNTATHRTQIYYNGKLRYDWPISSGRPGDDTPDGSYLTIEKANPVQMTGPGYSLSVPWSVRFTFSGDYYHDAYWSVGEQGFENVSHGCVNLAPANAETYYNLAVPGDPITVMGSPKGGTWGNGWTEWFLTWPQYLKGSALHEAVQAGPSGSTFVDPSTLPPSTASAPLQTSPADNSAAR